MTTTDTMISILTNTTIKDEPNHDEPDKFLRTMKHYHHYYKGGALTMLPIKRLESLDLIVYTVLSEDIAGDLLEAGVWRGGTAIFMRWLMDKYYVRSKNTRKVWALDSFAGFPTGNQKEKATTDSIISKMYSIPLEEVKGYFDKFGYLDDRTVFVKGFFSETLPYIDVDQLSVLRIDADLYESTKDCLHFLYPKLSRGGFVIIDDYGEEAFDCAKAVDEYRDKHRITEKIHWVDSKCIYWRKG